MESGDSLWYVTFGLGARLADGKVTTLSDTGLRLGGNYVLVTASGEEEARKIATEVLGAGNWASIYPQGEGERVMARTLRHLLAHLTRDALA